MIIIIITNIIMLLLKLQYLESGPWARHCGIYHVIFTATLQSRYFYKICFRDGKLRLREITLPKVTWLVCVIWLDCNLDQTPKLCSYVNISYYLLFTMCLLLYILFLIAQPCRTNCYPHFAGEKTETQTA